MIARRPENLMRPKSYSAGRFSHHPEDRLYTTEISTLCGPLRDRLRLAGPAFSQVYNDACDVGFTIVGSNKAGLPREAIFAQDGDDMNGDEIAGWRFVCVWPPLMKKAGYRALVVND